MNIPLPFLLGSSQAEVTLGSVRTLRQDVVWPVTSCYEALAYRVAMLFMEHNALSSVTLHSWLVPEVSEDETTHIIKLRQHLKLSTLGVEVFDSVEAKMTFLASYAPTHMMGSGLLQVDRAHPAMAAVLQDPAADDAPSRVHHLAATMAKAFKAIQVDVYSGEQLG